MRSRVLLGGALVVALIAAAVAVAYGIRGDGTAESVEATRRAKEVSLDQIRGPDLRLLTDVGADLSEVRRTLDASKYVERYSLQDLSTEAPPVESPVWIDLDWTSARNPAVPLMNRLGDTATLDFRSANIETLVPSAWREWDLLVLIDAHTTSQEVAATEERIAADDRVEAHRRASSRESYEYLHELFPNEPIGEDGAGPMVYVRVRSTVAPSSLVAEIQTIDHVVEDGVILAPRYKSWWE